MIKELFDKNMFIYIMLGLCLVGVLIKLILELVYLRLVKASENMGTSKNKLVQSMKKKFEAFYKLRIGVNNVDIFVDKYVLRHKFCGILLSTWENICGQIVLLCVLTGSITTILGLIYNCGKEQILSTFTVGLLTTGLLIFLEGVFNISGKKEVLRLNMKDYLENYLKIRLEQGLDQPELLEQYKKEFKIDESDSFKEVTNLTAVTKESNKLKENKLDKAEQKRKLKLEKKQKAVDLKRVKKIKKEEKKRIANLKKEEIKSKKLAIKDEQERIRKEAKAAIERKREAERLEIERIKAEVKAEDDRKKEEKRRQEEIKKALSLEKKAEKEEKKKAEGKTIAQEKKEILLKEISERRNIKSPEEELAEKEMLLRQKEMEELQNNVKEEVALTTEGNKVNLDDKTKEKLQTVLKKGIKHTNSADDKLIEDILKEFLA